MNWNAYLAILLALVSISGNAIYIKDTLKGVTKPNRITYLLWSLPILAGIASVSQGFSWASIMTFSSGVMPFLIFLVSFVNKNAYWKLGRFDYTCGLFALVAIVLWMALEDPVLTIMFCIIADGLAAIPTIIKSYKYPETETKISYLLSSIVFTVNLLNIKSWSFIESAFPLYLFVCNLVLVFCLYRENFRKNKSI